MNIRNLLGGLLVSTLVTGATLVAGATTAGAAGYSLTCALTDSAHNSKLIRIYDSNVNEVGQVEWNGDSVNGDPGDAFRVYDGKGDGWGLEAHLSTGRTATTVGHTSPYWSPWATGDLPENTDYSIWVVMRNGSAAVTTNKCLVTT